MPDDPRRKPREIASPGPAIAHSSPQLRNSLEAPLPPPLAGRGRKREHATTTIEAEFMTAHHVLTILAVDALERSATFYAAAFGWVSTVSTPVYVELAIPGGMRLGLYQREAFARNPGAAPGRTPAGAITATELYLHVDDLELAIRRLQAAGARPLSERAVRDWGDEAAYFADPDGNVLVVARPLPG